MQIVKLEPSKHVKERWLIWLEDGSFLRVTENEVVSFALYTGSPMQLAAVQPEARRWIISPAGLCPGRS